MCAGWGGGRWGWHRASNRESQRCPGDQIMQGLVAVMRTLAFYLEYLLKLFFTTSFWLLE